MRKQLDRIKKRYSDKRRTEIQTEKSEANIPIRPVSVEKIRSHRNLPTGELVPTIRESLERTFQEIWSKPDEAYVNFQDEVARGVVRLLEYGHMEPGIQITRGNVPIAKIKDHEYPEVPTCKACRKKAEA